MLKRLAREERGAGLVEFAIGATVLFTLVLLIMQGALMFQGWLAVTNATREGARAGAPCYNRSVSPCTAAQIQQWTLNAAAGVSPAQLTPVSVSVVNGSLLQVTLGYQVPVIAPMMGAVIPNGLTLSGTSAMRLEN